MTQPDTNSPILSETRILSLCNFLSKGWEVSILGVLAFLQHEYGFSLSVVGLLSMAFIVSQITVSFFAGRITHAIGSRNVVLLAILSSGLSWLTLSLVHHSGLLYAAYAVGGVASGLFEPIGNSLVARRSTAQNRGTAIGNFAAFGDMGRIALVAGATAVAGLAGIRVAAMILFASTLVAFVLARMFITITDGDSAEQPSAPMRLADLLANRRFCYATAAGIADSFSSASLYIFIPFLLTAKGISLANTLYFNVIFFGGYMTGRLLLGRLADRKGAARVLIVAELTMALLIVLLTIANGVVLILAILYFLGVFTRGSSPVIRAMVADTMDERMDFHDAFSAYSFASRGATAVCRPIYGVLAASAGVSAVFYTAAAVSMLTIIPARKYDQEAGRTSRTNHTKLIEQEDPT